MPVSAVSIYILAVEPVRTPSGESASLAGTRILVVEDDYFVANEIASVLRDHGAQVLGPVPDAARSRELSADSLPQCVLLDINLKGKLAFELAEEFIGRGVPAIFTTGYDASFLPPSLRGVTCLQKPIETHDLIRAVRDAVDGGAHS